jgi:hypothetical protein
MAQYRKCSFADKKKLARPLEGREKRTLNTKAQAAIAATKGFHKGVIY